MNAKPNVIVILADDMGYSDIGCYGGEINTPVLNGLAAKGLQFTQFYTMPRCCPSRASLLTGLYPHQADIGHMMFDDGVDGYLGDLSKNAVTIAEALKPGGYRTYMSGKWHVTRFTEDSNHNWPCQRGFDDFYGIVAGAANYYHPTHLFRNNEEIQPEKGYFFTDAIAHEAARQIKDHVESHTDSPFFQYVAFTAPHWPLHAHEEDVQKYKGRFDEGYDVLREQRLERMRNMGILDEGWELSKADPARPKWDDEPNKAWSLRRMEVYAAMVERMDKGIGEIIAALDETGQRDNTIVMFLVDNGGCAEEITDNPKNGWRSKGATAKTWDGVDIVFGNNPSVMPGGEDTYQSYGRAWANLSNTPFRLYKHWVHEGGVATPFIMNWPDGIKTAGKRRQLCQTPDIMATVLDIAGVAYPARHNGNEIKPLEGFSFLPVLSNGENPRDALYWEHEGNRAVRKGKWKLVSKHPGAWELYDMEADRTETTDLSARYSDVAAELTGMYDMWAKRCNVLPWDEVVARRGGTGAGD